MQPTQVNAAQLLMSFLDSEQGKLSKKIAPSQFSRELEAEHTKLMQNVGGGPGQIKVAGAGGSQSGVELATDARDGKAVPSGKGKADGDEKSSGGGSVQRKASRISREKVKQSLVFTNPLVIEKIVGQLQIPAEKRQACMSAVDSQGSLSLTALSAILTKKTGPEPPAMTKPVVAAQDVRSLISSLRQVQGDHIRTLPQLEAQGNGSYSLDQFRELLDAVVHKVADAQTVQRPRVGLTSTSVAQAEPEAGEETVSPSAISPDRVERLSATSVPFFSEDEISEGKQNSRRMLARAQSEPPKTEGRDRPELEATPYETRREDASPKTGSASYAPERPRQESAQRPQGTSAEKATIDSRPSQPEPRAAARPQSPIAELIERFKLQSPVIQAEISSQPANTTNTPSVNLVSSLAAGIDGKIEIKGLVLDKTPSQSSSDPTGNLPESSPVGDKVTAPQDSDHAAWQGSHEDPGQNQLFSHYERESRAINGLRLNDRVLTGLDQLLSLDDMETNDPEVPHLSSPATAEPDSAYPLFDESTGYVDNPGQGRLAMTEQDQVSPFPHEAGSTVRDIPKNSQGLAEMVRTSLMPEMDETGNIPAPNQTGPEMAGPDAAYPLFEENTGYVDSSGQNRLVMTERDQASVFPHEAGNTVRDIPKNSQGAAEMVRTSALPGQDNAGYVPTPNQTGPGMAALDPYESLNSRVLDFVHTARPADTHQPAADMNGAALADAATDEGQSSEVSQAAGNNENRASTGEKGDGTFAQSGFAGEKPGSALLNADRSLAGAQNSQPLESVAQGAQNTVSPAAMSSGTAGVSSEGPISCHLASWPEALAQKMSQAHQQGRSQMTIELEPDHLGKLSLRIETHHDRVTAFIAADNEQAKALLLQNSSVLRHHLEEQGLRLDQFFVDVREGGSNPRRSFQRNRFTRRESGDEQKTQGVGKSELATVSSVYGRKAGQQLISLFA